MHLPTALQPPRPRSSHTSRSSFRTLVVVDADLEVLDALDRANGAAPYDRVLLSPRSEACGLISRWRPSLVVVCMSFDDVESYQLLSMLAVNPDTRRIPVVLLVTSDHPEDVGAGHGGPGLPDILFKSVC